MNAADVKVFNRSLPVDYKHSDVIHMVVDQKGTFKYPVDGLWYFKMGKYEVTNAEYASFLLLQLNDDGTAVLGQAYSSDDLESLRNSIDTEKLTPEQKTFLDGMKANDVLAMNGWYTMKPNADGSMVLCVSYEVMYPTDTRIMSIASYVKEVSADRMLIFSGDTSDDGKPMFDEVLSVEKSSVKPGTLYDQSLIMALPKKDGN